MTNKDYKRLTIWNKESQRPCMSTDNGNEQIDDIVIRHVNRLYELENAIKNGMLVFLPCKVGDNFWWISGRYPNTWTICKEEVRTIEIDEQDVSIIDMDYTRWYLSEVYFTKEAVEKALKELK